MGPLQLSSLLSARYPIGSLAGRLLEYGGDREPLIDALTEGGFDVLSLDVGENYYVETVTKYYVGRVAAVSPTELVLTDAAWIDDTGRLNEFLRTGKASGMSVEPYPDPVRIPGHMITDATPWRHKLFREVI